LTGKLKLLAKRKKEIVEKINLQYSESYFVERSDYFILKDDISYPVNDRRSVLYAMADKKTELTKFLHDNRIKFRKNLEADLVRTSAFYDGFKKDQMKKLLLLMFCAAVHASLIANTF
jgi:hypothetical protein